MFGFNLFQCTIFKLQIERDWNSWDDSPRTVNEHIEQYRQKLVQPKANENDEPAIDHFQVSLSQTRKTFHIFRSFDFLLVFIFQLFQDMIPKVKKQKKVFIDTNTTKAESFSRLQATGAASIPRLQTAELEDWSDENIDDTNETGWDEGSDEATKAIIREKRREARAQRHQRLQQQKLQQHQMQSGLYANN